MSTMSNDPKQNNSPGMSSASSSAGEPPPPPNLAEHSISQGKEHLEQGRLEQLQERQAAMRADVEKQKGDTQSQQSTKEQSQNKAPENPER